MKYSYIWKQSHIDGKFTTLIVTTIRNDSSTHNAVKFKYIQILGTPNFLSIYLED